MGTFYILHLKNGLKSGISRLAGTSLHLARAAGTALRQAPEHYSTIALKTRLELKTPAVHSIFCALKRGLRTMLIRVSGESGALKTGPTGTPKRQGTKALKH